MSRLLIYRASAGAGKTHTLVTHYIKWALKYPNAFKHILAVTFTNRATQEMKQRILAYLYSLSVAEQTVLLETLCQAGWKVAELQQRSKEVLSSIVHQYGDFSITTIDSFFHKVIQAFTKELGLQQSFVIEMNQKLVLQEAVNELVTQLPYTPLLEKWIVNFALDKLLQGKQWRVEHDIQNLGKTLFEESFKLYEKALVAAFQQEAALPHFLLAVKTLLHTFEAKMQKIGQAALRLLEQEGLMPEDFAYGTKGVIGYFLKIATKQGFEPTKRTMVGRDNPKSWLSKAANTKSTSITRLIETSLHPLLIEAMELYAQEGSLYKTAVVVSRFTHTFGIIGALLLALKQYRSKHNVLFISDISALLYQIIQKNDMPLLYERIGNQFHHFLIDEFQDLSLFQWMNIQPLLRNSLAQSHTNLLVGDVKQSIYRWRGSNWKLLNHQVEEAFKDSQVHCLATNRRSKEMIVLFNNHFFHTASDQLTRHLARELISASDTTNITSLQAELEQIQRAYRDVKQEIVGHLPGHSKGYVELLFIQPNQLDQEGHQISWKVHAQKATTALVEQLQQEGLPAKDIVLLVRNNSEATLITNLFSNHLKINPASYPYEVSSDHSRLLSSHTAIKVLIHTLYCLSDADNSISQLASIQAYYSCMEIGKDIWNDNGLYDTMTSASDIAYLLPRSFHTQKDFLKNLSIYACIELLIEIFFGNDRRHSDVLSFFQSIVLDFFYKEDGSIQSFLTWWEQRGKEIKLPISNHANTIRVMTIHQSKGLEFNVVIMPFCSWELDHTPQNSPILWTSTGHQEPFNHFPVLPLRYGTDLKGTYYTKDYHLEQMQIYLDNLNLLYVAFTRGQSKLYIMSPLPEKMENMDTVADLVYQSCLWQTTSDTKQSLVADIKEVSIGTKFCFGS
ncbi:UvrD-helicase domain-containing protein [Cardinium endosymbiont of Tipula unca]|uniref:UvrD-helicase domain-containing protein n=1 Tax=Cardinium endosymbiont of Tipula unca TaxID=3066216 RepID=UPI0030CC3B92